VSRRERLIWACPVVFLVHDVEEILTVETWLRMHGDQLPRWAQQFAHVTTGQFSIGVLLLFVVFLGAATHGARCVRQGRRPTLFLVAAGALVLNALGHIAQGVYFGMYAPGIITSIAVVLPYGFLLATSDWSTID
jgi:hypothetical protein